jgi:hypothetical protein
LLDGWLRRTGIGSARLLRCARGTLRARPGTSLRRLSPGRIDPHVLVAPRGNRRRELQGS